MAKRREHGWRLTVAGGLLLVLAALGGKGPSTALASEAAPVPAKTPVDGGGARPTQEQSPGVEGGVLGDALGRGSGMPDPSGETPVFLSPGMLPPKEIDPDACRPVYPKAARRAGREGLVIAVYTVTRAGRVEDIKIVRSAPAFDAAVRKALAHCRFHPARYPSDGGKPISVIVIRNFRFVLPPEARGHPAGARDGSHLAPASAPAAPGLASSLGATLVYQDGARQCGIIARFVQDRCVVAWVAGAAAGGPTAVSPGDSVTACGTEVSCEGTEPGPGSDDAPSRGGTLYFGVHPNKTQSCVAVLEARPGGCTYHESFFEAGSVGDGLDTFVPCGAPAPGLACWDAGQLICDCPTAPAGKPSAHPARTR